jgi:gliding motility-associated protein GldC
MKKSDINIGVQLDENNVPQEIAWSAEDGNVKDAKAKAFMLAIWDEKEKSTMKVDLWTKEMQIDEMKQFFHQTLLTMSDTFEKATGEKNICEDLRDYCYHFADKMGILPAEGKEL